MLDSNNKINDKNKIAFVVPGIFLAGGIRVVLELAEGLSDTFDTYVISPYINSIWPYRVKIITPKIPRIASATLGIVKKLLRKKGIVDFSTLDYAVNSLLGFRLNEIDALKREIKADIAIATWYPTFLPVIESQTKPLILMQDFPELVEECCGQPGLRLFRTMLRSPMSFLSISSYTTELIKTENPNARIYYIGNGIDLNKFYPRRIARDDIPQISVMIRRQRFKGGDIAINALNDAFKKAKFKALVISEFEKDEFESRFRPQFPYVYYRSGINDDILARLYSSSDIFLFTSKADNFPLPPLEAMACGTAVVSIDSKGGIRDYMINGYNALVAKTKNPDEIADLLVQALDNKELRSSLIHGGLETAKKWDFKLVVERTRKALEEELKYDS
ncbi:MAG: glycosyltransferase family 4 protein [Caldisphaera sp.]